MSYEPTLIIRKSDLEKHENVLLEELYHRDDDVVRVAKLLSEVLNSDPIKFDEIELFICQPEITSFNKLVRERLDDLEVEYKTYW